ncbi:hypothetical protein [Ruminococcus sp. zg-924]|uniref:RCC1 domain-containing protein n=1 Tax=Ruminococcus sp. zg-924 TaxID=2678505 RepID=UPI002108FC13|nr:hypothetical protein [Ruminococcus sp. zg-924]MCQ4022819.1 hypothetical protein [Ruminococcus sp. zg-924]
MDNINQLAKAFDYIKTTYGIETIYSPDKIKALLLDLVPQCQKETKIFINVLYQTEIVKMAHFNYNAPIELVISRIIDIVGMSREWAKESAVLLFEYFEREYVFEVAVKDTHKVDCDESIIKFENSDLFKNPTHTDSAVTSLLKRTQMFLEDGDYSDARTYCEKILDIDPYCAIVYLYKLMAEKRAKTIKALCSCVGVSTDKLFYRALSYADDEFKQDLLSIAKEADKYFKERCEVVRSAALIQGAIISASNYHIAGVCSDGTVWAVGGKDGRECNVSSWKNIVAVSAGSGFTVGIKADGRVVITEGATFTDFDAHPRVNYTFDLSIWTDIVAVSSKSHIVGLKSDGTVIAQGLNRYGECNVSEWTDIISIATDYQRTVGLKSDGTVVTTGNNRDGDYNTQSWKDIVAIATTMDSILGLKRDGTVVCTTGSENRFGQCNVSKWTDIVAISSNGWTSFGVKADGTVVATKHNFFGEANIYNWKDVVALAPMGQQQIFTTFCVKKDGTIDSVGSSFYGINNALNKKLFNSFDTWESEFENYKSKTKQAATEEYCIIKQKAQYRSQNLCQHCGGAFKGLFTKKCSNCGKEKDY